MHHIGTHRVAPRHWARGEQRASACVYLHKSDALQVKRCGGGGDYDGTGGANGSGGGGGARPSDKHRRCLPAWTTYALLPLSYFYKRTSKRIVGVCMHCCDCRRCASACCCLARRTCAKAQPTARIRHRRGVARSRQAPNAMEFHCSRNDTHKPHKTQKSASSRRMARRFLSDVALASGGGWRLPFGWVLRRTASTTARRKATPARLQCAALRPRRHPGRAHPSGRAQLESWRGQHGWPRGGLARCMSARLARCTSRASSCPARGVITHRE